MLIQMHCLQYKFDFLKKLVVTCFDATYVTLMVPPRIVTIKAFLIIQVHYVVVFVSLALNYL